MDKKKPVSITLSDKDRRKVDALAASMKMNRSEMVRQLIRSKRQPKKVFLRQRKTLLVG